jgi:hypothetical protein
MLRSELRGEARGRLARSTTGSLALVSLGFLSWGACADDESGAGGDASGGGTSAASVCFVKLQSSYECSDGASDHSDPGTWICRADFGSLSECQSVMVGLTDYADGCAFTTTAREHTWLAGTCEEYPNGPPGTGGAGGNGGNGGNGGGSSTTSTGGNGGNGGNGGSSTTTSTSSSGGNGGGRDSRSTGSGSK